MKTKFLFLGVFLLSLTYFLKGQEEKQKFLYVETGIDFISCESPEKDYIRGDIDPYSYGYVTEQLRSLLHQEYVGVKFEYRLLKNLLGISGGFRYTRMISSIGKSTYWSEASDFFYVLSRQDGTTTEYAKVREIVQKSDYLGVPVELRIYPNKDYAVNIYYKIGATFNLNIINKEEGLFYSEEMNPYRDEVSNVTEDPLPFYASVNLGAGLKIGKQAKPGANFEVSFPVGIIPSDENAFVTPQMGVGFQLMVRIPF
ncbi:MAG: outer membrane beta-barrel protein [Bacteroidales bacterium]|nr:outer membrane beta-barrel protein [Bacteroidales bacterium]